MTDLFWLYTKDGEWFKKLASPEAEALMKKRKSAKVQRALAMIGDFEDDQYQIEVQANLSDGSTLYCAFPDWGETRTSKILGKMGISAMPDYSDNFFKPHKACFDFPFPIQV